MMIVLIVSQKGPNSEPRYRSRISCIASADHIQLRWNPCTKSATAAANLLGGFGQSAAPSPETFGIVDVDIMLERLPFPTTTMMSPRITSTFDRRILALARRRYSTTVD